MANDIGRAKGRLRLRLLTGLALAALSSAILALPAYAGSKPPKPSELDVYLADKPAALRPLFGNVITEGERNRVLNLTRAGLAAMDQGEDAVAAGAFDQALERIEAIYADNPKAERARSKFVRESTKDFKGEAYERAMAYYYRGLLYLGEGDYENARASFLQGQIQDAFAEDQRYKSDYALFEVLAGWATQCLGDSVRAEEFYANAKTLREGLQTPGPGDRTLLIADMGLGPQKYADGQYSENLRYRGQSYPEGRMAFLSENATATLLRTASQAIAASQNAAEAVTAASAAQADLIAKAQTARAMAEATAQAVEARAALLPAEVYTPPPSAPALVSSDLAPAPSAAPPKLTAAEKAAQKAKADAEKAQAQAQEALARAKRIEDNAYLSIALKAALAADQADAEAQASAGRVAAAREASALAVKEEAAAKAALVPYGLRIEAPITKAEGPADKPLQAATVENVFFQASTRGGRAIDGILAGKASFKAGAEQFSNTMSQTAMIALQTTSTMASQAQNLMAQGYNVNMSGVKGMAYASAGIAALSMIGSMTANAAKPAADIRYWDNLPGEIVYATSAERSAFTAVAQTEGGAYLRNVPLRLKGDAEGRCRVGWGRTRSAADIAASAPNSAQAKR